MTVIIDTGHLSQWAGLLHAEVLEVARRIEPAVAEMTREIEQAAVAAAPVRTGALRSNIRSTPPRKLRANVRIPVAGRQFYARFQEFGTKRMAANPFLLVQADKAAHQQFETRVDRALTAGGPFRE